MRKGSIIIAVTSLVFIGIGFLLLVNFKSDNHSNLQQNNEVRTKKNEGLVRNQQPIDESDIVMLEKPYEEKKETRIGGPTEPDFENEFKEKYGIDQVNQAKEAAGMAIGLWILDQNNESEWLNIATEDFYINNVFDNAALEDILTRKITSIEMFPTQPETEDDMRFSIFAEWKVMNGEAIVNNQSKIYYVSLIKSNGKWLVNKIESF